MMFEESSLEKRYKIPAQLREPWPEQKRGLASVYHFTDPESLQSIAESGLRHYAERKENELDLQERHRLEFDALVDATAKEHGINLGRSHSVFADAGTVEWQRFGDIRLEIKVDPQSVYVSDRQLLIAALFAFYRTEQGKRWLNEDQKYQHDPEHRKLVDEQIKNFSDDYQEYLKRYIESCVTLHDFLNQREASQMQRPEVMIPSPVLPEAIRVQD